MAKITFTTKEYKPHANSMSPMGDPVFVDIEETDFPTNKGDKKVGRIRFFPSSSISKENIKKALQIENGEVKKLTFEIEIDGNKIEAKETPKHSASASHGASHSASVGNFATAAGPEPELKNDWENEILSLRKFGLPNVKTNENGSETPKDQGTGTPKPETPDQNPGSDNPNKGPSNPTPKQPDKSPDKKDTPEPQDAPPKNPEPSSEEVNNAKEKLKQAKESGDKDRIVNAINETKDTVEKSSDQDLKKEKELAENKLGELDKKKLREIIREEVEKKLQEFGIKADDLGSENKQKLDELNNNNNNNINPEEAKDIRTKVLNEAGEKSLDKLINELKQAIETNKSKKEIENKIKSLQQFIGNNSNEYAQNAYSRRKDEVQKLLENAKNQSSQNNQGNEEKGFFRLNNPLMWLSGVAIIGLVVGAMLIIRSRRRNLKVK